MSRIVQVYPKAFIKGSTWTLTTKVGDSSFDHIVAAGMTVTESVRLLKLVFSLTVGDTDTDQDVDDAVTLDVAQGGPTNGETLWESWVATAESIISSLALGFDEPVFWAEWSKKDTARIRNAAKRILVTQRGWTLEVGSLHQHEGDRTVLEE